MTLLACLVPAFLQESETCHTCSPCSNFIDINTVWKRHQHECTAWKPNQQMYCTYSKVCAENMSLDLNSMETSWKVGVAVALISWSSGRFQPPRESLVTAAHGPPGNSGSVVGVSRGSDVLIGCPVLEGSSQRNHSSIPEQALIRKKTSVSKRQATSWHHCRGLLEATVAFGLLVTNHHNIAAAAVASSQVRQTMPCLTPRR